MTTLNSHENKPDETKPSTSFQEDSTKELRTNQVRLKQHSKSILILHSDTGCRCRVSPHTTHSLTSDYILLNIQLLTHMLVFVEGKKPDNPEKNPPGTHQTKPIYICRVRRNRFRDPTRIRRTVVKGAHFTATSNSGFPTGY